MHDIIPIFTSNFNNSQINSIDARKLHEFLKLKKDFSNWIKNRLKDFIENDDYIRFAQKVEANNATKIEYIITIDVAKHISMIERNAKGREIRQYFIDYEKQVNNQIQPQQLSRLEILQMAIESEKKVLELENTVKEKDVKIEVLEVENLEKDKENQKLKTTIKDFFKGAELFTRRQVCHFLARQGLEVKEQQITDFLNKKRWLCTGEHNKNKATAEACKVGLFVNDISVFEINRHKKTSEYGKFTVDGMVAIYNHFKK